MPKISPSDFVVSRAKELGFVTAGITGIDAPESYASYTSWLERNDHGSMAYMADDFHLRARADMRELLPSVQSAIVVALSYPKAPADEASPVDGAARGRIAQYALGDDYHYLIKSKLAILAQDLQDRVGHSIESRACVDSAPLLERALAKRAGLGFIGKNTMLIAPGIGSYFLLGVLLTSEALKETSAQNTSHCGSCTACLDACPTQAFRAPFELDAKRCISYLTIESREPIPEALRAKMGDRIFGCDACQSACPFNGKAPLRQTIDPKMAEREENRARPRLSQLAKLGSNQRKRYVNGSPMRRNNRNQLLRNVAVALSNTAGRSEEDEETLLALQADKSELVRDHVSLSIPCQDEKKK